MPLAIARRSRARLCHCSGSWIVLPTAGRPHLLEASINGPDRALGFPSVCDRDHRLTPTPCRHCHATIPAKFRMNLGRVVGLVALALRPAIPLTPPSPPCLAATPTKGATVAGCPFVCQGNSGFCRGV